MPNDVVSQVAANHDAVQILFWILCALGSASAGALVWGGKLLSLFINQMMDNTTDNQGVPKGYIPRYMQLQLLAATQQTIVNEKINTELLHKESLINDLLNRQHTILQELHNIRDEQKRLAIASGILARTAKCKYPGSEFDKKLPEQERQLP